MRHDIRQNPGFFPLLVRVALSGSLLLAGVCALAQQSPALPQAQPEEVGMSSARFGLLETMLRQHVDDGRVPGLVAGVMRHGKVVYLQSLGWQDIEAGQSMRDDSIFQIRSMTKAITSLAVMQLAEQGRLSLDDPLADYIPSFAETPVFVNPEDPDNSPVRPPARAITLRDLLLNIGGLSIAIAPCTRAALCARAPTRWNSSLRRSLLSPW